MSTQVFEQQRLITEEQITSPLIKVINDATPKIPNTPQKLPKESPSLKKSLEDLFPEQAYEDKKIQQAKKSLGPLANEFTPEQLKDTITEIQFLAESWLDDFERSIFDGHTLQEMLHERGGR